MFDIKHRKESLKEAQVILALALAESDSSNVKAYVKQALDKLCLINKQDGQKVQDTIAFVNECLKGEEVGEVLGCDAISLANLVGKLRNVQVENEDIKDFFYEA